MHHSRGWAWPSGSRNPLSSRLGDLQGEDVKSAFHPLRGVILFAHGSRDPLWHLPIDAVRQHIASNQPQVLACCAYLELCQPNLAQAVQQLCDQGAQSITIVPMFLGTGKHAREDLPQLVQALRSTHPDLPLAVQAAIGEDPRMTALMAQIAGTVTPAPA